MTGSNSLVGVLDGLKIGVDANWSFQEICNEDCTLCGLHEEAQSVCLVGQGPKDAEVMFIGEAPGEREDDLRLPFQGRAGERLNLELMKVGLDRKKIYITNVVKCHPPDNRDPSKRELTACLAYLEKEIEAVKPKFILLLGNEALKGLLKKSGITKYRGRLFESHGAKVIATFHPSAVNRFPKNGQYFAEDMVKFKQLIDGVKSKGKPNVRFVKD